MDLENERKGLNYDSENLFAFGFMSSEKLTSTPDSGLMCSDRTNYYLEIIPISNPNYQNVDDTTVGNNFFKINLYTSDSSLLVMMLNLSISQAANFGSLKNEIYC